MEDEAAVCETLAHHLRAGFRLILALSPEPLRAEQIPADPKGRIVNLLADCRRPGAHVAAVNAVIDAAPGGTWIYYGYNAEFLFFPFAETRSMGEMLAFHAEERRRAMLTYVIDLYAPGVPGRSSQVNLDEAHFDRTDYFALGRTGKDGVHKERQYDFHGGLRWRFEEFIPPDRRRIDRIGLFRTEPGLRLLPDHRLSVEELNTYAGPWHNNLTAAVASFREAKARARNPASRDRIQGFGWRGSHRFDWTSQQLMDMGLMEPGQWF